MSVRITYHIPKKGQVLKRKLQLYLHNLILFFLQIMLGEFTYGLGFEASLICSYVLSVSSLKFYSQDDALQVTFLACLL
jgi:hypothetical protein